MQHFFRFSCAIGAVLLLLATPAPSVQAQQATSSSENIAKGKENFVTYACASCHGYSGQGSDRGPRIDTNRLTFLAFSRYVRQPAGAMPRYRTETQIPDAALEEIYAFLKSVPPPPDPKSIPLLNQD